jgi:hypothetical protein
MDHPVEAAIRTNHFNYEVYYLYKKISNTIIYKHIEQRNAKVDPSSHYFLARAINQNNCQPQAIIPNDWQIPETQIVTLAETTIGNKEILAEANKVMGIAKFVDPKKLLFRPTC